MTTDFQKYQAGRALLSEIDELLEVDARGYSKLVDANVNDAKLVLTLALEEICRRAERAGKGK